MPPTRQHPRELSFWKSVSLLIYSFYGIFVIVGCGIAFYVTISEYVYTGKITRIFGYNSLIEAFHAIGWVPVVAIVAASLFAFEKLLNDLKKLNEYSTDIFEIFIAGAEITFGVLRSIIIYTSAFLKSTFNVTVLIVGALLISIRLLIKIAVFPVVMPFVAFGRILSVVLLFLSELAFWLQAKPIARVAIVAAVLNLFSPSMSTAQEMRFPPPEKASYEFIDQTTEAAKRLRVNRSEEKRRRKRPIR